MDQYNTVASDETIKTTIAALEANGFKATVVEDGEAAKKAALDILPKGAEVMTATSRTLETVGLVDAINQSGDYDAVYPKLAAMYGDPSKKREQRKIGTAPDYIVGSIHALTQDGHALIASNTGSQLPAYTYGAGQVIWVVGAQKIVKDLAEAEDRLNKHVFPLENERAKVAYGGPTSINKLLQYRKEGTPDRVQIIIAKESLGF
jgi:hypothetical protein